MVDQSAIGRRFAPITARVEPGRLRYFLGAIGEQNDVFRDDDAARRAGYERRPIPPTYLFCLEMMDAEKPFEILTELDIDLARILHGDQNFTYHAPVMVGDMLTFVTWISDVADKKGGALTMVVARTAITNQNGKLVAETSRTTVIRN